MDNMIRQDFKEEEDFLDEELRSKKLKRQYIRPFPHCDRDYIVRSGFLHKILYEFKITDPIGKIYYQKDSPLNNRLIILKIEVNNQKYYSFLEDTCKKFESKFNIRTKLEKIVI